MTRLVRALLSSALLGVLASGLVALLPLSSAAQAAAPRPLATVSASARPSPSVTGSAQPSSTAVPTSASDDPGDEPADDGTNTNPSNDGFWLAVALAGAVSLLAGGFVAVRG